MFQSIRNNSRNKCEIEIQKQIIASMDQEIRIDGLKQALVSALLAAVDWKTEDRYDLAVISIKADGRNEKDNRDPMEKYFPIAILDNLSDDQKKEKMASRSDLTDVEKIQEFETIKLQRLLKSLQNDLALVKSDIIHKDKPFRLPAECFNLRKLLSMLEWPPAQYASFEIKIQLFEKEACKSLDPYRAADFSEDSRLFWAPEDPDLEPKEMLFRYTAKRALEIREMHEQLTFNLGNDSIRPFKGLALRLATKTPAAFAEKFSKDDLYLSLK